MPDGFCSPFRCHRGIMANSTMHQPNAIPTHSFSARPAGFHQMPLGDWNPVFMEVLASGKGRPREGEDLPQAPEGVERDHHDDAGAEQQEDRVEEPLAERQGFAWGIALLCHASLPCGGCQAGTAASESSSATVVSRKKVATLSATSF